MKDDSVALSVKATPADAHALRALRTGTASPEQQKRALDWITLNACAVATLSWRETDREMAFLVGRQFVGLQIGRLLTCDLNILRRKAHVVDPSSAAASS